jgi:hypothetical protein
VLAALAALALGAPAARACDDGLPKIGYLGISNLECSCSTNFMMTGEGTNRTLIRRWIFRSEPVVGGVLRHGPSAGKLRDGDVITAVNGALITTREGGMRFSRMAPGETVTLRVRRDGREIDVPVTVGSICAEELSGPLGLRELIAPRAPEAPEPSEAPDSIPMPEGPGGAPAPARVAPGVRPTPFRFWIPAMNARPGMSMPDAGPEALPRGWMGIGLVCQECGGELPDQGDTPVWTFGTLPTISYVEPEGPAARAGLRRGDQLTHIDGVSLLTSEGGKRFGAVKGGQKVRWTFVRDGSTRTIAVTAAARPEDRGVKIDELRATMRALRSAQGEALDREMRAMQMQIDALDRSRITLRDRTEKRLRYAGSVAGSDVEVRGLGNVVVDDSGDEIVITTRDATIRIHPSARAGPAPRPQRSREGR